MIPQRKLFPIGVLTAAAQEPCEGELFHTDPIEAALQSTKWWIELAKRRGNLQLQLAVALAKPDSWAPAEAMLDPVAAHGAFRTKRDGSGEDLSDDHARDILNWCEGRVVIGSLGFFENMLHEDDTVRNQLRKHLLRAARAALKINCHGLTIFIGRNPLLNTDENLLLVESQLMPLFKELKALGIKRILIENCPMPGWNTRGLWVNNLACEPGIWFALHLLAVKHDVDDVLGLTYDGSHDILQGGRPEWSFRFMNRAGCGKFIREFHGKDLHPVPAVMAAWGRRGQFALRGDRGPTGQPAEILRERGAAWCEMVGGHSMVGVKYWNPALQAQGLETDWIAHQIGARTYLGMDPEDSVFLLENEFNPIRDATKFTTKADYLETVEEIIVLSADTVAGYDRTAACHVANIAWLGSRNLPLPNSPWDDGITDAQLDGVVGQIRAQMKKNFGTE